MTYKEVINIKEYIDQRFEDLNEKIQVQFQLNDKALQRAAEAYEERLKHLNEFKSLIQQERATYARKEDVEFRLKLIEQNQSYSSGQVMGKEWAIGLIVAIVISLGTALYVFL